jgi:hypothetical protein
MTTEEDIRVSVSGSVIYRAVANYFKNNKDIQDKIQKHCDSFTTSEALKNIIHNRIQKTADAYGVISEMNKAVKSYAELRMKE